MAQCHDLEFILTYWTKPVRKSHTITAKISLDMFSEMHSLEVITSYFEQMQQKAHMSDHAILIIDGSRTSCVEAVAVTTGKLVGSTPEEQSTQQTTANACNSQIWWSWILTLLSHNANSSKKERMLERQYIWLHNNQSSHYNGEEH